MLGQRRRRWWTTEGLPALRLLALEHWDPENVYDDPSRAGIYDPYLERLGRMLRRGKGPGDVARNLGSVRTKVFRLDPNEAADELFADQVVAWYSLEAPRD
jgi:hypothetical protein